MYLYIGDKQMKDDTLEGIANTISRLTNLETHCPPVYWYKCNISICGKEFKVRFALLSFFESIGIYVSCPYCKSPSITFIKKTLPITEELSKKRWEIIEQLKIQMAFMLAETSGSRKAPLQ
jgi:DNA-directed RNA polymerase subunit RPC12/RpoP